MFNNSLNTPKGFSSNASYISSVTNMPSSWSSNYTSPTPQPTAAPMSNPIINCPGMTDYTVHQPTICSTINSSYPTKIIESGLKGATIGLAVGGLGTALTGVPQAPFIGAILTGTAYTLDAAMSNPQSLHDTTYQVWEGNNLLGSGDLLK
jgi:hypothetical protein